MTTLFDLEVEWDPIVTSFANTGAARCRDCGGEMRKLPWAHGCGGAGREGFFTLCDGCAALDGLGERQDGAREVSRWGIRAVDPDGLRAAQESRRAKYRKAVAA